jgi:hypothetical protein
MPAQPAVTAKETPTMTDPEQASQNILYITDDNAVYLCAHPERGRQLLLGHVFEQANGSWATDLTAFLYETRLDAATAMRRLICG